ncbi:SusC/RagA family TonB-linked outer membrane protein [Hymenobacter convexus]|uniref:SusC/RagA family TonB-linked outer membrane protein n=1 Tax=Hymenobacter sp. CA1UV-4 TaxID=3063782 RepID=UPI002713A3F8|nr:TonB-dependent receptor [Hymenobacter sp. CA1UV-4]MDO7851481.1 TonB-dependent receptor [Hymenobacter sp. CA1UV-4]
MNKLLSTLPQAALVALLAGGPALATEAPAAHPAALAPAADRPISGRVTDEKGAGLPGVTVLVKGTSLGTTTGPDGSFALTAPDNATLVLSFVGYKTQEIAMGTQATFAVQLANDAAELDEIVVTGYQTQKKADLTGAVAVVKVDEVKDLPSNNVARNLQGRVPGVNITTDGAPDGNVSVRIRGIGTLGNNDPLYVIDGIPTKDGINQINQNDIESIQVLKDASAASIYGSRAGNGVIIITTKRAKKGVNKVDFNTFFTFQGPGKQPKLLNTEQYGRVLWQAAINDGVTPPTQLYTYQQHNDASGRPVLDRVIVPEFIGPDQTQRAADTNWFNEIQQNSLAQSYNLNLSTGGEKGGALVSLNYFDNKGVIKYSEFERFTGRINSDYNFFGGRLKVGENLTLVRNMQTYGEDRQARGLAVLSLPIVPVRTVDGVGWGGPVSGIADRNNPVRILEDNRQNKAYNNRAFGNFFADLEVVKGLHLRSSFGLDYNLFTFRGMYKPYKSGYLNNPESRVSNTSRVFGNWVWQNTLNYNLTLGRNQIDFLAGTERISYDYEETFATRTGFAITDPNFMYLDAGTGVQNNGGYSSAYRLASYFGKINYAFADKYLVSATLRRDGSSRFGKDNQFGLFPAVSAGWRLSEEGFIKDNARFVSDFKLRAGWGQTGNQDIAYNAARSLYRPNYGSDPTWDPDTGTAYDINGNKSGLLPSGFQRFQQGNDRLKWETTSQTNLGVDFGFLENQLSGSVDYFVKNTKDILVNLPYPAVVGEGGGQFINGASLRNKGWEFLLNYQKKLSNDLAFNISGNLSSYRNEVTYLPAAAVNAYGGNGQDQTILGRSIGSVFGYVTDGLFRTAEEVTNSPTQTGKGLGRIRYQDLNGDGKIDAKDQTWISNGNPDFSYGLNLGASYKGFDVQVFLQGVQGLKVYSDTKFRTDFSSLTSGENWGQRTLDAWTPANPDSNIPAVSLINNNNEGRTSTYFLENGSYLKLRNVQLGYSLPAGLISKLRMTQARVYVQGQNLLAFYQKKGDGAYTAPDPEVQTFGYPIPVTFTTGLNISF